jgi:hypothetical protein
MDGYVEAALKEFKHTIPKQVHNGPSKVERPDYEAKIQYIQEDHTKPLTPEERYLWDRSLVLQGAR